jgi:hypothetical protein
MITNYEIVVSLRLDFHLKINFQFQWGYFIMVLQAIPLHPLIFTINILNNLIYIFLLFLSKYSLNPSCFWI